MPAPVPALWTSVAMLSRLVERFRLQDYPIDPTEALLLLSSIQPVTQVDELVREPKILGGTFDLSGAGTVVSHTVPTGKRWRLNFLYIHATVGNSEHYLGNGGGDIILRGTGTAAIYMDMGGKRMDAGWKLSHAGTSNGGDAAVSITIWYEESDA